MAWTDVVEGSGKYISLKEDGQSVTFTVLAEPVKQMIPRVGGQPPRKTYLFAVLVDGEDECSLWRAGVGAACAVKAALKDGELMGRARLTLTRHGKASDRNTTYQVTEVQKNTPAYIKKAAAVEFPDLAAVKVPDSSKF
jgi:hypothetical protein